MPKIRNRCVEVQEGRSWGGKGWEKGAKGAPSKRAAERVEGKDVEIDGKGDEWKMGKEMLKNL